MAARNNPEEEVHHVAPRCLVPLHERANGSAELDGEGIQAWLEWEMEAMRWRVPVEISRSDLEALVASSEAVLERERHRLLHSSDWRRWGRRGGRETLRRYGSGWFALLALKRWGRITAADLEAAAAGARWATGTSATSKPPKTAFNGRGAMMAPFTLGEDLGHSRGLGGPPGGGGRPAEPPLASRLGRLGRPRPPRPPRERAVPPSRVAPAQLLPGGRGRVWILTEADRSATTLLLPEEY